ncbi:hypothetical protein OA92_11740 [Marinomonas sp. SBI22]|nr:hypothetical protein OA92_11740 [Marinomonas sp. SBI22]KZM44067.1 hypothetical protein OA91_11165 [Marinomonas sp. SBI8L]
MLVAGSYFRQWMSRRRELGLNTTKSGISEKKNVHSYLMHLGFFDFIGMKNIGKCVGVAKGNTRYLPIREIRREELDKQIEDTGEDLIDAIIFLSDGLANVLAGEDNGEAKKGFSYSIREIIRNALEHSGSDSCFICGQRWVNGQSEIAIIDEGNGIHKTLSTAYELKEKNALVDAIKPGVSRTQNMSERENIYKNSGFGLYVLSELGNSFGWFCVGSGLRKLRCEKGNKVDSELPFEGTFVGIHLNKPPLNFDGVLQDIISVGEEEAGKEGRNSEASEISKTA